VRAKLGDPDCWPFKVTSGVYPPEAGSEKTHTQMNHDNSQLWYDGIQEMHHYEGPRRADVFGVVAHQLFAINTAAAASIEWVTMLQQRFPSAKQAIDYARSWDIRSYDPAMSNGTLSLEGISSSLGGALLVSCATSRWDGSYAPVEREGECRMAYAGYTGLAVLGVASNGIHGPPLVGKALSSARPDPLSSFTSFFNEFLGAFWKVPILHDLSDGFASQTGGDYVFDSNFVNSNMPSGACRTAGGT
jgi:hypothetical protein